ncbi:hypothetical protein LMG26858_01903 [Achromobacter anxifer]|jgi:hypothetical protein|uniref:Uncharacterized protein n=2 Tax=Achromobacter anxifer TaxID=1287737 RepID=A0A6S7CM09_9BURK|nr:hypothetical protein LMG26858_01903 [Achromobacter anxifer]CAB5516574.1 hypothetical protein LMG26857_05651 [Achromobacter anxifer]
MPPNDIQPTALGALVVNEMLLLYGAKFAQQWQGLTARELKDSWNRKLDGLDEIQVRRGLLACLTQEWPPTLPQFIKLCCPWMVPEVAYHEAVRGLSARRRGELGVWSHPAVYWAAVGVSTVDLLGCTYGAIKARWEKTLNEELAKGSWPDIPVPRPALPAPGQTLATRAEAEATLRKMGAEKVLRQQGRPHRSWIAKWEARIQRGEHPSKGIADMLKRAKGESAQEAVFFKNGSCAKTCKQCEVLDE